MDRFHSVKTQITNSNTRILGPLKPPYLWRKPSTKTPGPSALTREFQRESQQAFHGERTPASPRLSQKSEEEQPPPAVLCGQQGPRANTRPGGHETRKPTAVSPTSADVTTGEVGGSCTQQCEVGTPSRSQSMRPTVLAEWRRKACDHPTGQEMHLTNFNNHEWFKNKKLGTRGGEGIILGGEILNALSETRRRARVSACSTPVHHCARDARQRSKCAKSKN